MLDVEVPHLHELLLAVVDVGELVNHAAYGGVEPGRVDQVLGGGLEDGVRRHRHHRRAVVVQSENGREKNRYVDQFKRVTHAKKEM